MCFPGDSAVKNPSAMQETWVHTLDQEDPLEEKMATYSGILAWEILQTEKPTVHVVAKQLDTTGDWIRLLTIVNMLYISSAELFIS